MVTQEELKETILKCRERGAIIRTWHEEPGSVITKVMVRKGIAGIGPGWMPIIQAHEILDAFLREKAEFSLLKD